jgi:NTE family protein
MGNYFSSNTNTNTANTELIEKLENTVEKLENTVNEQLTIIELLRCRENTDQCIKDGIIQNIGEDSLKDIELAKANKDYEYIVLSGGGIKGISYCGALDVLEKYDILYDEDGNSKIKGYAGTSAGSIIAGLLAVGYTPSELKKIMKEIDFKDFLDDKFGYFRDAVNFVEDYGMCPGEFMYDLLGKLIEDKTGDPDYTIRELYEKADVELVLVGTDMNALHSVYFWYGNEEKEYSNIPIRKAIRTSVSVPFLFEPIVCNGNYCVDGGVLDNYPIHVFDGEYPGEMKARLNLTTPNPKVLGLNIMTDTELMNYAFTRRKEIESVFEFSMSFIDVFLAENERRIMTPSFWKRTINLVTPDYPLSDFSLGI